MNKTERGQPALKPYHVPKLVVYGDIRSITQNQGGATGKDGKAAPNNKTS